MSTLLAISAFVCICSVLYCFKLGVNYQRNQSKAKLSYLIGFLIIIFSQYGFFQVFSGNIGGLLFPLGGLLWGAIILSSTWVFVKIEKQLSKKISYEEQELETSMPERYLASPVLGSSSTRNQTHPKQPKPNEAIDPRVVITTDGKYMIDDEVFLTLYSANSHLQRQSNAQKHSDDQGMGSLTTNNDAKIKGSGSPLNQPTTLFAVNHKSKKIFQMKKDDNHKYKYNIDQSIGYDDLHASEEWSVFETADGAQQYRKKTARQHVEESELLKLRIAKEAKAAEMELLLKQKTLLKEFRLRTLPIPTDQLKQAMFAVTGNKYFIKTLYNPKQDDMIFNHISKVELDELYTVLK